MPGSPRNCVIIASLFGALVCGAAIAQVPSAGSEQGYPNKPIRLIVPFPPGAPSDLVGRLLGQKLSEQLGANVVPENRPGAGGNVGIGAAAKAPPDGYTLLLATPGIAISPSLYSQLSYDADKDLAPIARLASLHNVLVVHPSVPATTLKQFISLARANPGKLNFGSGGAGTTNHLANEFLKKVENIHLVHVPYKGATQAMLALIGGEIDEVIVPIPPTLPQIRADKVRPLAVLAEQRVPTLPEVPTGIEAGVENFVAPVWYGLYVPARTPRDISARLSRETIKALEMRDLREQLTAAGIDPWPGTPEDLVGLVHSEVARYAGIIKSIGLRLD